MTDDPAQRQPKNPLGPTGQRVIDNVKRLRLSKGLTYKQLSERLGNLGRPIPVLGLSRLERGERRIDVDDLVALAVALETTPNRLLLPAADVELAADTYKLTPAVRETPLLLWAWATGEVPLGHVPSTADTDRTTRGEEVAFSRVNKPHLWTSFRSDGPVDTQVYAITVIMLGVAEAFRAGVATSVIRIMTETALANSLSAPNPRDGVTKIEAAEDGRAMLHLNYVENVDIRMPPEDRRDALWPSPTGGT